MEFSITFSDAVTPVLDRLEESLLGDMEGLHSSMGLGVADAMREHLDTEGYVGRQNALGGKSTGFWKSVSESIDSEATSEEATVTVSHRGFALQLFGGEVTPKTRKALSIPVVPEAHGLNASEFPGKLMFIPASTQFGPFRSGGGQDTVGYLMRVIEQPKKSGNGTTEVPGDMVYVLRARTYHEPDPNVIPSDEKIIEAAAEAGGDYLGAVMDAEGGLS